MGRKIVEDWQSRFWSKVDRSGECWLWLGGKHPYGVFWKDGRQRSAHVVSYELAYGSLPDGLYVLHSCDVPRCVNPQHLFAGTALQNTQDMVNKRRNAFGTRQGLSKVTPEVVRAIRLSLLPQRTLARQHGISQVQVGNIKRLEQWRSVL